MRKRFCMSIVVWVVALATPAHADVDTESQIWTAIFMSTNTQEPGLVTWFDAHARRSGDGNIVIVRPAVGYRLDRRWVLHAGYAWVPTIPDEGQTSNEHRFWQQLIWAPALPEPFITTNVRPRLEQRWSEQGSDVAVRFRLFARTGVELTGPFMLSFWDEVFVHLNDVDWGPQAGFDQNRVFAGVGLRSSFPFRVELGYMNVIIRRPSADNRLLNNFAMNLFVDF